VPTAYPYSAVLFDMDGTLIDDVPLHQAVSACHAQDMRAASRPAKS
jgi:beta-phosphoglucomutase-like phosphatase (HAD superfamily)